MKLLKKFSIILSSALILSASCHCISAEPESSSGADNSTQSTNLFTNSFDYNYDNTINWNKYGNDSIECFLTNTQTFQNKGFSVNVTNIQNANEGVISDIGHHIKPAIKYYNIKFYVFFESDQADRTTPFSITILDNRNGTASEVLKKSFDVSANNWDPISCSFSFDNIGEDEEIKDNDFSVALSLDKPDDTLSSFYFDSVSLNDITKSMESINERKKESEKKESSTFNSTNTSYSQDDNSQNNDSGQSWLLLIIIVVTCILLIVLVISFPVLIKKYSEQDSGQTKKK